MKTRPTETRHFAVTNLALRASAEADGQKKTLAGYAAVFNSRSEDLGGFTEIIAPGAFTKTLSENRKIKALAQHDWAKVLGSVASGTLRLAPDETGLRVEVDPPDTTYAADLAESISRGDIDGMSFAFEPIVDEWEYDRAADTFTRTLKEIRLFEVSFVTRPAYPATTVALRDLAGAEQESRLYQAREEAKRHQPPTTPAASAPEPDPARTLVKYRFI